MERYVCEILEKATDKPIATLYFDTRDEAEKYKQRVEKENSENDEYVESNVFVYKDYENE